MVLRRPNFLSMGMERMEKITETTRYSAMIMVAAEEEPMT